MQILSELCIVGLGVSLPDHITVAAAETMSKCSQIFAVVQEPPSVWLPTECAGRTKVFNALQWYRENEIRNDNYRRAADAIFEAVQHGGVTGYVTYGNPMLYDKVASELLQRAKENAVPVKVVPGVSSIDTIFCDLTVEMAPALQIVDASWLVACSIEPATYCSVLLLQIGTFGTFRAHYQSRHDGASLSALVAYLTQYYPAHHSVTLVRSTADSVHPSLLHKLAISNLCDIKAEVLAGSSLFIPPCQKRDPEPAIIDTMRT